MAIYAYAGRGRDGRLIEGVIEAQDSNGVAARLRAEGIAPVRIRARADSGGGWRQLLARLGGGQPSTMDLVLFSRQMLSITKSGVPLLRGVRSLIPSTRNAALRQALVEVLLALESGRELAVAMAQHPRVFNELYVSLVRVGEQTGTLEKAFAKLADALAAEQDVRDRVTGALRYPAIVIAAIVAAVVVLTTFVIPKFEPIFRSLGDSLPLPTRILLGTSRAVQEHWPLVLLLLGAVFIAIRWWLRTASGRLQWDEWRLRIPVFGRLMKESILARSMGTLALTLEAGLPMLQALSLIARASGNAFIAGRIDQMRLTIEAGEPLSRAAATSKVMPPLVLQMMEVGEETGELTRLLEEVAGYYQREVDYALKNLTAMLEPILIVVVGGMVLVLALGIFLPMWEMLGRMAGT